MTSFTNNPSNEILTLQLGKGQDFGQIGCGRDDSGQQMDWIVILDGNGSNKCIDILKTYNWPTIVMKDKPIEYVMSLLGYIDLKGSGSTCAIAKIYKDKIKITAVGDSQFVIFVDNKLVYVSKTHDLSNPEEKIRIKPYLDKLSPFKPDSKCILISDTKITVKRQDYCRWGHTDYCAPTQLLGYNNRTQNEPLHDVISINEGQHVRVVGGSDGLFDMIIHGQLQDPETEDTIFQDLVDLRTMTADQLMDKTVNRWKKKWEYAQSPQRLDDVIVTTFPPDGMDDITVSVYVRS